MATGIQTGMRTGSRSGMQRPAPNPLRTWLKSLCPTYRVRMFLLVAVLIVSVDGAAYLRLRAGVEVSPEVQARQRSAQCLLDRVLGPGIARLVLREQGGHWAGLVSVPQDWSGSPRLVLEVTSAALELGPDDDLRLVTRPQPAPRVAWPQVGLLLIATWLILRSPRPAGWMFGANPARTVQIGDGLVSVTALVLAGGPGLALVTLSGLGLLEWARRRRARRGARVAKAPVDPCVLERLVVNLGPGTGLIPEVLLKRLTRRLRKRLLTRAGFPLPALVIRRRPTGPSWSIMFGANLLAVASPRPSRGPLAVIDLFHRLEAVIGGSPERFLGPEEMLAILTDLEPAHFDLVTRVRTRFTLRQAARGYAILLRRAGTGASPEQLLEALLCEPIGGPVCGWD